MKPTLRLVSTAILALAVSAASAQTASPADWREKSIYFLMTDRFANGDTSNDDFGKGEYLPDDVDFYHGGDFAGLTGKLDYIQGLGMGAIWVSPPVANQWVSPYYGKSRYAGFHGYWAQDLYAVDKHLGGMEAYKAFVKAAHERGIMVIQDIVCNHFGDFTSTDGSKASQGGYPEHPAAPFEDQSVAGNLFHYNGKDFFTREYANLDDLNTENPVVVRALIDAFKFWIKEADIDGFRIDTVIYVPMDFWKSFVPEILAYAKSLGKENFIIFGEDYEWDLVTQLKFDAADARQASYTGSADDPLFNSMLDFAFCGAATSVFTGSKVNGRPEGLGGEPKYGSFAELDRRFSEAITSAYSPVSRDQLITFLDNHDMTRINAPRKAGGDLKTVSLALGALFTLPGIPCLYYGTEQGYAEPEAKKGAGIAADNRQNLWTSGYDVGSTLYRWVATLNKLRAAYPALTKGRYVSRIVDGNEGAIYSYSRILDGHEVLILINRSREVQWLKPVTDMAEPAVDALAAAAKPKLIKKGARVKMQPQSMMILVPQSDWKAANPGGS